MIKFLIVMIIFSAGLIKAQDKAEVFRVFSEHVLPQYSEDYDSKTFTGYGFRGTYGAAINRSVTAWGTLNYKKMGIPDAINKNYNLDYFSPEIGLLTRSGNYKFIFYSKFEFSGDGFDGFKNRMINKSTVLTIYDYSENIDFQGGVLVLNKYNELKATPLFGIIYKTKDYKLDLLLPIIADFTWYVSRRFEVGLFAEYISNQYILTDGYYNHETILAEIFTNIRLFNNIFLHIRGGYHLNIDTYQEINYQIQELDFSGISIYSGLKYFVTI